MVAVPLKPVAKGVGLENLPLSQPTHNELDDLQPFFQWFKDWNLLILAGCERPSPGYSVQLCVCLARELIGLAGRSKWVAQPEPGRRQIASPS
jgi:hypothetical protein